MCLEDVRPARSGLSFGLPLVKRGQGTDFDALSVLREEPFRQLQRCILHEDILLREDEIVIGLLDIGDGGNHLLADIQLREADVLFIEHDLEPGGIDPKILQERLAKLVVQDQKLIAGNFSEPGTSGLVGTPVPLTRARRVDGGYRITGRKAFASMLTAADYCAVLAYPDEATSPTAAILLLVPRHAPGRRVEEVAEMLAEGDLLHRAQSVEREREVHRHVGNYTLFMAGIFPEFLHRLKTSKVVVSADALLDFIQVG